MEPDDADVADDSIKPSNVRVLIRVRPTLSHERMHPCETLRLEHDQRAITMLVHRKSVGDSMTGMLAQGTSQTYSFDSVMPPECSQEDVYTGGRVRDMVQAVLQGYNATIFAYGQTGSGKTFTMEGHQYRTEQRGDKTSVRPAFDETPVEQYGIALRAMQDLFASIQQQIDESRRGMQRPGSSLYEEDFDDEVMSDEPGGAKAARRAAEKSKRSAAAAAESVEHGQPTVSFVVRCSFCQIYQEQVYDLLVKQDASASSNSGLRVRWDSQRDFYVENLYTFECKTASEAIRLYRHGIVRRVVAGHKMNASSSRSHCLFTMHVDRIDLLRPQDVVQSKFVLVDLAGSERSALTGATGVLLQQSIGINKSLFVLRKVIAALAAENEKNANQPAPPPPRGRGSRALAFIRESAASAAALSHVPYRDSTLTRLLKPSLGGNSFTLMIACLAPSDYYMEENLSTLNYASLAKRISNTASVNEDPKTRLIRLLRKQVKFLKEQLARAQQVLVLDDGQAPVDNMSGYRVQPNSGAASAYSAYSAPQSFFQSDPAAPSRPASQPRPADSSSSRSAAMSAMAAASSVLSDTNNVASNVQAKLVDSVKGIKALLEDNNQLRSAVDQYMTRQEHHEFETFVLNKENEELRERIQFLESVISGEQDQLLETLTNPMMWRASTSQGTRTPMPRSASAQSILPDDGDPNTSVTSGADPDDRASLMSRGSVSSRQGPPTWQANVPAEIAEEFERTRGENRHLRQIVQQTAFELQQARTELEAQRATSRQSSKGKAPTRGRAVAARDDLNRVWTPLLASFIADPAAAAPPPAPAPTAAPRRGVGSGGASPSLSGLAPRSAGGRSSLQLALAASPLLGSSTPLSQPSPYHSNVNSNAPSSRGGRSPDVQSPHPSQAHARGRSSSGISQAAPSPSPSSRSTSSHANNPGLMSADQLRQLLLPGNGASTRPLSSSALSMPRPMSRGIPTPTASQTRASPTSDFALGASAFTFNQNQPSSGGAQAAHELETLFRERASYQ